MNNSKESDLTVQTENNTSDISRRLFRRAAIVRAIGVVAAGGLATLASVVTKPQTSASAYNDHDPDDMERLDRDILVAADAESLAVATYWDVTRLASDDQSYLMARQEELSHYLLEQSVTDQFTPFTSFFLCPFDMSADAQTMLNTLVTLEDAFIAAYLAGVRNLSTPQLQVTAALIRGTESDHRTLARDAGPDVAAQDGGPIETTTVLFISPGRA